MKALRQVDLNNVVFIDIETVRIADELEAGSALAESWDYKMRYSREASEKFSDEADMNTLFKEKAALYAEFAKIVCITIGKVKDGKLRLKSYSGANEKEILTDFTTTLEGLVAANPKTVLCGHAIKGFDIPFLMRRCLVNRVPIPDIIDVADVKPWLMTALDTLELWKGTGFYSASLINIAVAMGLPSPKQDMNGSETSDAYYKEGVAGIERIARYCEADVLTVCNIVRAIRGEDAVEGDTSAMTAEKVPLLTKVFNTKKISPKEQAKLEGFLGDAVDPEENKITREILAVAARKTK